MRSASSLLDAPIRRRPGIAVVGLAVGALALAACGGDDDDADSSTTTTGPAATTVTTVASSVTTAAPATTATPTTLDLVTDGAIVIVANASGINGSAGRMSDRLAAVGFQTGTPVNSTEGQLETTKVYYDPENPDAEAVAGSVRDVLGGGDILVIEVGTPPPIDTGELNGASVIVALGNDTADKSLEELQGLAPPSGGDTGGTGGDSGDTGDDTTGDDTTGDDTTGDDTTGDDTADETTGDVDI